MNSVVKDTILIMINYKKHQLTNGLTVITAPMKGTKTVSVLVMVKVGSRYETKQENGISHFLEHMFFKGTNKRPTSLDISKELDSIGAEFNAFTSEEYTGFYISSSADHFDKSLDILSDMLHNSKFEEAEIIKEKGVILEEVNMYKDIPQKYVQDLAKELLYGKTPLGKTILGEPHNIKSFKRKDFINYIKKHYQAQNTYIAIAGNPGKFDWFKMVDKSFGGFPKGVKNHFVKQAELQKKLEVLLHYKKTDQAHLILGFRTINRYDPRRYDLKVMNNLFGGIMSSRLFTEIRENRGLAYYVGSSYWEFDDVGALLVSAGLDKNRVDEAIKVILEEFNKLKNEPISEEELIRSKENIKGRFYLNLEESYAIAEFLADQQLLYSNIKDPDEIIKKIMAVKSEDITKLAQEFFTSKNLNLTIIGPYKDKTRFEKLLKI
ncbi:MAG: hypothetical protein ACD_58C00038G0002 [uncultured bacterium]|nr:MAG: hypothetical protein ACD_58C00038G0002 [uncultured bacterium]